MFEVGLLIFLAICGMAFWMLIFMASYIPIWITMNISQMVKAKLGSVRNVFEEIAE